mmetsp:Transcript_55923/g.91070  ORF Transcript_55923/g.91070 Transcript_55923/m.91070 type:complete len:83 (-) Transcript_55923:92-340(-)
MALLVPRQSQRATTSLTVGVGQTRLPVGNAHAIHSYCKRIKILFMPLPMPVTTAALAILQMMTIESESGNRGAILIYFKAPS